MSNRPDNIYTYSIPINEPAYEGASVTMFVVTIQDNSAVRRGAIMRRALRINYGLSRHEAKVGLRAMKFDNLVT